MNPDPTVGESGPPAQAPRRRAPGVAVVGLAGLVVAGWGLADGPRIPDPATLVWIAVGVAVAIGALLILSGTRSANRH